MTTKYDILVKYLNEYLTSLYNEIANDYKIHIKKHRRYELTEDEIKPFKEKYFQVYATERCIKALKDSDTSINEKEDIFNNILHRK